MSSIGFMDRDGEARVSGREHAKFGCMLRDLSWHAVARAFDVHELAGPSSLRHAVDLESWVTDATGTEFARWAKLHLSATGSGGYTHMPDARSVATMLDVNLNTVAAGYSAPVVLAARLVAQCEVNAWIAGEDRGWLADLIDTGRATPYPPEVADSDYLTGNPLFADEPSVNGRYDGWKGVVDFLRAGDSTVVLDYSVTDGFPDIRWACWPVDPGKKFRRLWTKYDPEQRWDLSERGLLRRTNGQCALLRISPDNLHEARYGFTQAPTWSDVASAWRGAATQP